MRAVRAQSRAWKFPDLRNGTTINFFADTQSGYRPHITDNWNLRVAADAARLKGHIAGHVHGGDCIEWNTPTPEDASYQQFRSIVTADGLPYVDVPGNHDLCTYASTTYRSANQWAQAVPKRTQSNMMARMGGVAVVGLAPDYWQWDITKNNYAPPEPLSETTINWLTAQLDALGSTPTWIATHALPVGQPAGVDLTPAEEFVQPWGTLVDIMASHGNVIGWLSGHWHIGETNATGAKILNAGGRKLFGINAPAASGIRGGWSAEQMQWQSNGRSMLVTYMGDSVDIRWRNHTNPGWLNGVGGNRVYQLMLS